MNKKQLKTAVLTIIIGTTHSFTEACKTSYEADTVELCIDNDFYANEQPDLTALHAWLMDDDVESSEVYNALLEKQKSEGVSS